MDLNSTTEPNGKSASEQVAATVSSSVSDTEASGEPRRPIFGRIATPPNLEATAEEFSFWVPEGTPVEKTQLVSAIASFPDVGEVTYYGVVEEVTRRSRRRDVLEERDRYDGRPDAERLLESVGVTYARTRVLTSVPPLFTPPREESAVMLAGPDESLVAYGVPDMVEPMGFALLKNGATRDAGPAYIDLAYLLGQNGAHVNVNGIAGAAAKSSALTTLLACLTHFVKTRRGNATDPLHIVPVVLNVKGSDLMFLDRKGKAFAARSAREVPVWQSVGIAEPGPFTDAVFFAPQQPDSGAAVVVGREAHPYSWGLRDLVEKGLFLYLFSDEDREDENFFGLATAVLHELSQERRTSTGQVETLLRDSSPARTLDALVDWVEKEIARPAGSRTIPNQAPGTWSKFYRRLLRVVQSGTGVLRRCEERGTPLDVLATATAPSRVVDVQSIADPSIQRFVVAAILRQVTDARTGGRAIQGLRYVLLIDELNRWAPRNGRDPITRLIEHVAAEMRSQGVILFGAQQQASQVSEKVIENAAIRLLGRTGALEIEQQVWRGLPSSFRKMVGNLGPAEKIVLTPTARQPMFVRMPFPVWAMRREDALPPETTEHRTPIPREE